MSDITVVKRDGSEEDFELDKISESIMQAAMTVGGENFDLAEEIAEDILDLLETNEIEVISANDLHKLVEKTLIERGHAATATEYILKGADRKRMREMDSALMKSFEDITFKADDSENIKKENANIDSNTAMGTMLKYGSEAAKKFNTLYMMSEDISRAHADGDIHVHDLDFLTLTETCCQIPLDKLFKNGFNTGHGFLRAPGGIRTAGALAAIAIQSNQNDQHGGQSIPMFDYYLAPYVAMSYVKLIAKMARFRMDLTRDDYKRLKKLLLEYQSKNTLVMNDKCTKEIKNILKEFFKELNIKISGRKMNIILDYAHEEVYEETFQSMEAFIHNLNTMHSRAGRSTAMVEVPVTWETLCPAV